MKPLTISLLFLFIFISATAPGHSEVNWRRHVIASSYSGATQAIPIDWNGDGDWDVVGAAFDGGNISWWENDGSQEFTRHNVIRNFQDVISIDVVDLDDDQDYDILGVSLTEHTLAWWKNNTYDNFTKNTISDSYLRAYDVMAIDVDSDNDIDIVSVAEEGHEITWWENDGSQNFTQHPIDTDFGWAKSVYAIDLDLDDDIDIIGATHRAEDQVVWFENDGNSNFTAHLVDTNFNAPYDIMAHDLDNDGDIDLIGAAATNNEGIAWWENDGSQNFTRHWIENELGRIRAVDIADFNSDGNMDVIGVSDFDCRIAWYENDGDENFTRRIIWENDGFTDPRSISTVDLDQDGDIDFLASANVANMIRWGESDYVRPPEIGNISRNPYFPQANEPCEISAEIKDNNGWIVEATLFVDNGSGYRAVQMDNNADSFYATIPGQENGTPVSYYISAVDDWDWVTVSDTMYYFVHTSRILNIPDDFPSIQTGILAAYEGDTVLVHPGIYYENIDFIGKNITVGSLFMTTGDREYVHSTVINGSHDTCVVFFVNGENRDASLVGMSITSGSAYKGGGFYCVNSNPTIIHNIIRNNVASVFGQGFGGGIYCENSSPYIYGNSFYNNHAYDGNNMGNGYGGGIFCTDSSNAVILNNTFVDNGCNCFQGGGGICCFYSNIEVTNCIFWNNSEGNLQGSTINPSYNNYVNGNGWGEGSFSMNPWFHDPGILDYSLCLDSPCIDAGHPEISDPDGTRSDVGVYFDDNVECFVGNRWFVSTEGNDTTGNGTEENPFKTIEHGIRTAVHGDTILVENGIYQEYAYIDYKNLVLASRYVYSGDTLDIQNTHIYASDRHHPAVHMVNCSLMGELIGFKVTHTESNGAIFYRGNYIARNNRIYGSIGTGVFFERCSTGIFRDNVVNSNRQRGMNIVASSCQIINNDFINHDLLGVNCINSSNVLIQNNTISNNLDEGMRIYGNHDIIIDGNIVNNNSACGILMFDNVNNVVSNNIISGNTRPVGAGIHIVNDDSALVENNIIVGNSAENNGGGIYCKGSNPSFINNIISANTAVDSGGGLYSKNSEPVFINNILWSDSAATGNEIAVNGGSAEFSYCDIQGGWEGVGNIDEDPLFRDPDSFNYHLMATYCGDPFDSPCIDMGHPHILDDTLDCDWGLGMERSDMGAYGGQVRFPTDVDEPAEPPIPLVFSLSQNYPNPFNPTTTINYTLPIVADVNLEIYNILGQKVSTLIDENQTAGHKSVTWNASSFSSGIYFYKLTTRDKTMTKRMTLLK